jgi:outer membrane protein OmpA-like peptidoglycan-associated protein
LAVSGVLALAPSHADDDVRALQGTTTRTLMLEDVPPCETATRGDAPLQVADSALSLDIRFELGSARLLPEAMRRLDRLAATLADPSLAGARFMVAGHTDARGGAAVNGPLSCARAQAVRDYLQQHHGIAAESLHVEGFGDLRPLDPAHPNAAVNRRVEVRRLMEGTR